ncbi:short transient receptor potential channel 4-like [Diadema setosum]|uniref:short transient receptor potential channel 4-like n=1 Tax=Diadema setosum TaxID=31175 RepID=UPI003B3BC040
MPSVASRRLELFTAIQSLDLLQVQTLLAKKEGFGEEWDFRDSERRSVYAHAIQVGVCGMVSTFIEHEIPLGDALLRAADACLEDIVRIIIKHLKQGLPKTLFLAALLCRCENDDYHHDITPLMAAAHRNNFAVVQILVEEGATLSQPQQEEDLSDLTESIFVMNKYRALASEAYMAQAFIDPTCFAFELSQRLRHLGDHWEAQNMEFWALVERVENFSQEFMAQSNKASDLQTLHRTSRNEQTEDPVAKIRQGVSADQKPFVTHPFTQNALSQDYYAELDGMKRPTLWLLTLMALVCYPVFSLLYLIYPAGVIHRFLKIPHISVFMHLGSDLTLMAFVIFLSVEDRSSPFVSFWCQMVTFIICLGISGRHVRMIYQKGPGKFLSFPMSLMDSLLVKTCFTTLYTIWISQLIDNYTHMTIQRYEASLIVPDTNATSSSNVDYNQGTANATPTTPPTTQFGPEWVTAQWDDPRVVSNALYSLVVTMCTIRTFYILTTNSLPIYVIAKAVVDMVVDVVRISLMYIYIMLAFGLGITFVYRSVWEMAAFDCEVNGIPVSECPRSTFSYSVGRSIFQLFWAIFGLVSLPQLSLDLQPDDHYMSYVFAFLFVGYMIISVVVLLNLLIAVMSSRYAVVESNADKEWKFSRSQVWLSYISQEDEVTLPPPFNLLPSTKQIHDFFKWCCSEKNKEAKPKKKLVRSSKNTYIKYRESKTEQDAEVGGALLLSRVELLNFRNEWVELRHRIAVAEQDLWGMIECLNQMAEKLKVKVSCIDAIGDQQLNTVGEVQTLADSLTVLEEEAIELERRVDQLLHDPPPPSPPPTPPPKEKPVRNANSLVKSMAHLFDQGKEPESDPEVAKTRQDFQEYLASRRLSRKPEFH